MSGMYAVFAPATPARAFSTASEAAQISGFSSQASFTYSDFGKVSKLASTSGSSSNFCVEGKAKKIIHFGGVIVDLEFSGEDGLLALEEFRASLDGRDLQGATIANAILVVTQIFCSEGGLLLRGLLLELHNKDGVIEGMNLQSDFIFAVLQIVAGSGSLRSGNTIFLADTQQLGQGLGDHGAARKKSLFALRE